MQVEVYVLSQTHRTWIHLGLAKQSFSPWTFNFFLRVRVLEPSLFESKLSHLSVNYSQYVPHFYFWWYLGNSLGCCHMMVGEGEWQLWSFWFSPLYNRQFGLGSPLSRFRICWDLQSLWCGSSKFKDFKENGTQSDYLKLWGPNKMHFSFFFLYFF